MAAPTLSQQGLTNGITTGNLAITLPAYVANDIVVITTVGWVPNTTSGTAVQSLASPWTKYSPDITTITSSIIDAEYACWWARATSNSSLGSTVTITRPTGWDTGNDTCWAGRAYVLNGCVTTGNPYDEFTATAITTTANPDLPAVTVSGGNRLVIVFMAKADDLATPTAASGYTVNTEDPDTSGTDAVFQSYTKTASANVSAVTPTGGSAPAQGGQVYFAFSLIPTPVTATASATLGGLSGSSTALVKHDATASATLGALNGSSTALVKHIATGSATLGGLVSTANATISRTVTATGSATLGGLSSSASATVKHSATSSATLDGLSSSASATVKHSATSSANLGGLSSSASATVKHSATGSTTLGNLDATALAIIQGEVVASAYLGGLSSSAQIQTTKFAIASSNFGDLVAVASATVTPVTPPTPPTPVEPTSSGGRRIYSTTPRKNLQPNAEPIVEIPIIEPKKIHAYALSYPTTLKAKASAEITFSILEDDAEVLLLV